VLSCFCFFFQAEDGIRDFHVTGVQTCALPIFQAFRQIAAEARGEAEAQVIAAHALTAAQQNELKATLKSVAGKNVSIAVTVDPSLLGGMVVKMGSRQIDTSLKTKLNSLKLALKEVG